MKNFSFKGPLQERKESSADDFNPPIQKEKFFDFRSRSIREIRAQLRFLKVEFSVKLY